MKTAHACLALAWVVVLVRPTGAEDNQTAADLAPPVRLTANGQPIDVPGLAAPFFGDFDCDGKSDLLVGQLDHGTLRVYRNRGTSQKPEFGDFDWFEAGGRVACVPTGCAVGFTPQLVDFDGDGDTDVLTGSFQGGLLYAFRRQTDGSFAEGEVIFNRQGDVRLTPRAYNVTVFSHDWDRDGDQDLLVGRSPFYLVPNEGNRRNPSYGEASKLTVNGEVLGRGRGLASVADWDGDGLADLIVGQDRDIVWYRNTTASGLPRFERARVLVSGADLGPATNDGLDALRQKPTEFLYAVCVADFDNDGRVDLLLGDHYYTKRQLTDAENEDYDDARRMRSAFLGDYHKLIRESTTRSPEELRKGFRFALAKWYYISRRHFEGPQAASRYHRRHGGVWLYRRLAKK